MDSTCFVDSKDIEGGIPSGLAHSKRSDTTKPSGRIALAVKTTAIISENLKRSGCIGYKDVVIAIRIDIALHKLADGPRKAFERIFDDAKRAISTIQEQRYATRCRSNEGIKVAIRFEVNRPCAVCGHGCETCQPSFGCTVSELASGEVKCPESTFTCNDKVQLVIARAIVILKLSNGIIEVGCHNRLHASGHSDACGTGCQFATECGDDYRIGCFIDCKGIHIVC